MDTEMGSNNVTSFRPSLAAREFIDNNINVYKTKTDLIESALRHFRNSRRSIAEHGVEWRSQIYIGIHLERCSGRMDEVIDGYMQFKEFLFYLENDALFPIPMGWEGWKWYHLSTAVQDADVYAVTSEKQWLIEHTRSIIEIYETSLKDASRDIATALDDMGVKET